MKPQTALDPTLEAVCIFLGFAALLGPRLFFRRLSPLPPFRARESAKLRACHDTLRRINFAVQDYNTFTVPASSPGQMIDTVDNATLETLYRRRRLRWLPTCPDQPYRLDPLEGGLQVWLGLEERGGLLRSFPTGVPRATTAGRI